MKTKFSLLAAFCLLVVVIASSCKEDVTKPEIEENYPLVGTSWELIGFVENNQLRKPELIREGSYTLSFESDIQMTGLLDVNSFWLPYSIDGNNIFTYEEYQGFGGGYTKICCDAPDAELYWDILFAKIQSFKLIRVDTLQQLKLFYGKASTKEGYPSYDGEGYLLFNKMEE